MTNTNPSNPMDDNKFSKRIRRYASVSGAVSKLGWQLASDRFLGLKIDQPDHAEKLKSILGNLRGPLLKIAQLLATIPDALPPDYAREFQQLQSNAPPMGWVFVKRRMQHELGVDWQNKFQTFSRDTVAAASLGQVHKATLHDGQDVACKLQYPDMASAIDADLQQLKVILNIFEKYDKAIHTKDIQEELKDRLLEELDYELEAKHGALYKDMLKDLEFASVPTPNLDLSTGRLLTSSWLDGRPIMDFMESDQETRNRIALNLFKVWYHPVYHYGIIHGDPHLGNYTIRNDLGINLLDFGCIRIFSPSFIQGVLDLYRALQTNNRSLATEAFERWGFKNLNNDIIDILIIWAKFLYGPLLEDNIRPIGDRDGKGVYGRQTAAKVHKNLRESAANIKIPREFVFMDRAALGLGSVFIHLNAQINWHELFETMIQDFDVATLTKKQSDILKKHNIVSKL